MLDALDLYFDYVGMYNGQGSVVGISGNEIRISPDQLFNTVYPDYVSGGTVGPAVGAPPGVIDLTLYGDAVEEIPVDLVYNDQKCFAKFNLTSGGSIDISHLITRRGYVNTDKEGHYFLEYSVKYFQYPEVILTREVIVSKLNWIKNLIPQPFYESSAVMKAFTDRLEDMYWDFNSSADRNRMMIDSRHADVPTWTEELNLVIEGLTSSSVKIILTRTS